MSTEPERVIGSRGRVLVAGGAGAITVGLTDFFRTSGTLLECADSPWGEPDRGAWRGLDQSGIHQALATTRQRGACLGGLVCVAAEAGEVEGPDDDQRLWRRMFDEVVISTDHLIQAAAECLEPGSSIVVVLSAGAIHPHAESSPRAAAMAACRNLSQSWAFSLAPNARVNALCVDPGCVTELPPAKTCQVAVAAVSFLLSTASMDVTGQTLSLTRPERG